MNERSIGLIELSSVAAGFQVTDTALKAGNVRLLLARTICSGKYMVLFGGGTAAVEAAAEAGSAAAGPSLIDRFVIANVHPDVLDAIGRNEPDEPSGALGVLESFSVAALIEGVFLRGRYLDRQELEGLLAEARTLASEPAQ